MKTCKAILSAILLATLLSVSAQTEKQFLDTVKINCSNQVLVHIATYDHLDLKKDTTLAFIISGLQENLLKIRENVPSNEHYKIIYSPGTSLVIELLPPISKYIVSGTEVTPYLQRNECEIRTESYHVYFTFDTIDGMLDQEIKDCISTTLRQLPGKSRYARVYNYSYSNGTGSQESFPAKNHNSWDMLNIGASVGAGLVRNSLITDIGVEVGLNFNKKGILKNAYYLSNNLVYVFNASDDHFALNDFLNIGYRYNFSNDPKKTNWIGPEIGFPVYKEGDFFRDNLFRAGIKWELGKSVSVAGHIYVNEGFRSAYPGLRIGFGF